MKSRPEKFVKCGKCVKLRVASLWYNHKVTSEQDLATHVPLCVLRALYHYRKRAMVTREKTKDTRAWSKTLVYSVKWSSTAELPLAEARKKNAFFPTSTSIPSMPTQLAIVIAFFFQPKYCHVSISWARESHTLNVLCLQCSENISFS